jgi:hypothetical protein
MSKARQTAEKLSQFANDFGSDDDELVRLVMSEHRTIQQGVFGIVQKLIVAWAKQENWDARNEHTIMACKNILEAFPDLESNTPPCI